MPDAFMMAPASTNIGMAMSENLVEPSYMSSATVTSELVPSVMSKPTTPAMASATAIGTLMQMSATRTMKMVSRTMCARS